MIKKITIISLSKGILGEPYIRHEFDIGIKRLKEYGIDVNFSEHALLGVEYLNNHPEKRAGDLIDTLKSDTDMILSSIGGDDTYKLLPYLFEHDELKKVISNKIFLGFSDTTINHFMFHKVGLNTFYGQAFIPDICELDKNMLPYTKKYFEELITNGRIKEIVPSDIWYDMRYDFSESKIATEMPNHKNYGFELLQGNDKFSGKILGGCIETIFDIFDNERHSDSVDICKKYDIFPDLNEWKDKILLLESSEEKSSPIKYLKMIKTLKKTGIFDVVAGVLIGKPADETYFKEYKDILIKEIDNPSLPIVSNINIGHATPRCIIPFGVNATVDVGKQKITFDEK